jgi:hypothetical protein
MHSKYSTTMAIEDKQPADDRFDADQDRVEQRGRGQSRLANR